MAKAKRYESAEEFRERVIREEIERHRRAYEQAQERHGWSVSNSCENTMRRHDILENALESCLRSLRARRAYRTNLSDIKDVVNANLKRMDEGWKDMNIRSILEEIRLLAQREE